MSAHELLDDARGRSMRQKEKKCYIADGFPDEEIDGRWNFSVEEKLLSSKFSDVPKFYIELNGSDLTLSYFQENGFSTPLLVKDKSGLGLRMPSENFSVSDVKRCVGSRRVLDVMDVNTQKGLEMTVKDWVRYYEDAEEHRHRLLNVISLEFSHTRLEDYVDQPHVIHDMDWIDLAWPWYYRQLQTQSTNALDSMMYPKVQKYCLMSVGGCYTDFHIDMGGTSVWYHVLKGQKVFWLIPPTDENLSLYVSWTLSSRQNDVFFGDIVETCYRITLEAGWTFFIPTGWIHAVYTPMDSLVFGGNFLHCFNMAMQLRIADIEIKTHVPIKFRYPLFKELHWYVLERYVSCVTGVDHRQCSEEELRAVNGDTEGEDSSSTISVTQSSSQSVKPALGCIDSDSKFLPVPPDSGGDDGLSLSMVCDEEVISTDTDSKHCVSVAHAPKPASEEKIRCQAVGVTGKSLRVGRTSSRPVRTVYLSRFELEGLDAVAKWLEGLPVGKRNVPKDIPDPDVLLSDVRALLKQHRLDDAAMSVTDKPILEWPSTKLPKRRKSKMPGSGTPKASKTQVRVSERPRRRRVRCRKCEPCTREDCRECQFCLDLKKYGGPQRMKKPCVSRSCLAPMLSREAACEICGLGDVEHEWSGDVGDGDDWSEWLMECRVCCQLVHPACLAKSSPDLTHTGVLDEDLPSSWDCARCCQHDLRGHNTPRCRAARPVMSTKRDSKMEPPPPQHKQESSTKASSCGSKIQDRHFTDAIIRLAPIECKKVKVEDAETSPLPGQTFTAKVSPPKSPSHSTSETLRVKRKYVRKRHVPSPEPEPKVYQVNSRGREIALPRRYLL